MKKKINYDSFIHKYPTFSVGAEETKVTKIKTPPSASGAYVVDKVEKQQQQINYIPYIQYIKQ